MKHHHHHDSESLLRDKGLKSTPLRLAILQFMHEQETPVTAEDIGIGLGDIEYDRATLFRSLKTFSEAGILSMIDLGEGFNRYEKNCELHHHHHHIICTSCKKIEIVPFCIPDQFKKFLQGCGYRNVSHRMDFSGICKSCS
jgi:Fe2+ or Zn2+ uptake regulation protein